MFKENQSSEAAVFEEDMKKIGLVIVGGGTGGLALLRLFHEEPAIMILGIADVRPDAAAIQYAHSLDIPTTTDYQQLVKQSGVDVVVDVTGNPEVRGRILKEKNPEVEILGGVTAKLMWNFTEILERRVTERAEEIKGLQEELLKSKVAILQELSSGVSRKLQHPLAVIMNSTNYLLSKLNDNPRAVKHLELIHREAQTTEKTVKELIDLVKPGEKPFTSIDFEKKDHAEFQHHMAQSERLAGIGIIATGIAHEINNPLAIILGKAEMILEEDEPAFIKKYTQDIMEYTKRASEIVERVSFYSKVAWKPDGEDYQVNMNHQLTEALKLSQRSDHFKEVEVLTDHQDVPPISGESEEIYRVFVNLMKNAGQAMKGKGLLHVKSWYEDGDVVVTIRDSGHGIKKEHLNMIFTPFFTTRDPGEGTGLGLNIVHKIVTNHGGSVWVESEEGKGSTFIVKFPKAQKSAAE